jgi:transcriptional regulator with XRE-family HTH domain
MHPATTAAGRQPALGEILRSWRSRRRRSQLDLALDVGVSTRHLSCIETGRARPSPAMLDALAGALDVPLRERNHLLLAAGYAPRYAERGLDDAGMHQVRSALERLLRAHEPNPGLVLDRQWNVVLANRPALALAGLLPDALKQPAVQRLPRQPASAGAGRADRELRRLGRLSAGHPAPRRCHQRRPRPAALEQEVLAYPNVAALLALAAARRGAEHRCWCPACCACRRAGCRCSPRSPPSARRATSRSTN